MSFGKKSQIVTVNWAERWQVYHRLQDMEIECYCRINEPLQATPKSPQQAIQLWSIVKHVTANRHELIDCLNKCWQIKSYQ